MANEIYRTTYDGLSALVSPTAASRVLGRALRRAQLDADTLDARSAQRLLRGPVRRELEAILPRAGVWRELKRLDRRVMRLADGSRPGPEAPDGANAPSMDASASPAAPPEATPSTTPATAPAPTGDALTGDGPTGDGPTERAPSHGTAPPASATRPTRPAPDPTRVAELDGVRSLIHARADAPTTTQGPAPDAAVVLDHLSRLSTRFGGYGVLRSWHVRTDGGHVLIGSGRDATLAVHGRDDLNLGAIYTAFAALEEES